MNLSDTPAGQQLSWFLTCLAKGSMDQEEVIRHFSPALAWPSTEMRALPSPPTPQPGYQLQIPFDNLPSHPEA